ncbi:MAG: GGDEF domain-containing protein [Candidatus Omnitrophica bacterium]|nr:GGDEF domain-containing protein [Candidatus Omnitrophota bacterium]
MRILWGLFWVLAGVALLAVAMAMAMGVELSERLAGAFLQLQSWLPVTVGFEQFLAILVAASLLLVALSLAASGVAVSRLGLRQQRRLGEAAAARREADRIQEQHLQQYDQIGSLGQVLSGGLDKRALVQHIIEAASRFTSLPQSSSLASLWLLHFETDTLRFERGFYCDETLFVKTTFELNEPPFAQLFSTQRPWITVEPEVWRPLVKPEKVERVGSATGLMLVPLIIENSVLGVLVVFCHPEMVKGYGTRSSFYGAVWAELTLALAIAVQGEVAILDRLTGVHNREYFMKRLIQEVERADRYQLPLSLLMADIDNFKLVNDMLGHPQGDAVLKIIAKLIRKAVRAIDLVGRYGGEEFIIMLPETGYGDDAAAVGGAQAVAERIRKAVDDEFRELQKPLNLSVSVGVATRRFPEDRAMGYQDLIRHADGQLYQAKTTGKNKVCVFQPEQSPQVS